MGLGESVVLWLYDFLGMWSVVISPNWMFWLTSLRSCGFCFVVLVKSICGLSRCRFGFDESHPRFEKVGTLSVSGVGYLMGDLLPFGRCGVVIASAEGDPSPVEVDGVPMGAIEMLALFSKMLTCEWLKRVRYCDMWGRFSM